MVGRYEKVGATALHVKASAPRHGSRWIAPRVNLKDAAYQRGYLMVTTDEGLSVRGQELTDARREDISAALSPGMVAGAAGLLFFHWGDEWSVSLEPTTLELRRSIKERQHVIVSPDGVTLRGNFEVTAIERELFDVSFVLQSLAEQWQIKTVLVNDQQAGFEYRVDEKTDGAAGRSRLRIELPKPIRPEKVANVTIELQHVPSDWRWPSGAAARDISVPLIESEAQTVSGHVLISALDDLDALPRQAPQELQAVPVGRMASLGIDKQIQYAYSYTDPTEGRIQLQVSRRLPRISAEAVGLVTAGPRRFSGHWRITYAISRALTRQLFLLADKSLGREIKITSTNVPISSKSTVAPGPETLMLVDDLAQQYDLWSLDLDHKSTGAVTVDIHYERPKTSDNFHVPLVRPICGGQISEQLAIQASEELALEIDASQAREIDAIDLPPLPVEASRILAAFRLEATTTDDGPRAVVALKTAVHKNYEIPSALASSVRLTTYLDPRGRQRTEAVLNVANAGRQFLTIRLPDGAQLWSLRVGDKQAKPQQSAGGDYQVALGRLGKPVTVKIVYSCRTGKSGLERLRLGGIELPGVEMNEVSWTVVPPPGHWIIEQETKMQTSDLVKPAPAYTYLRKLLTPWTPLTRQTGGVRLGRSAASSDEQAAAETFGTRYREELREAMPPQMKAGGGMFGGMAGVAPPATGRPTPQAQQRESRPAPPQQPFSTKLIRQGRYTLPVELVPTPGAGPQARFTGLGATELVISLTSRSRQTSWWVLGFILVLAYGILQIQRPARFRVLLVGSILSAASLLAVWMPAATNFSNGAFTAGTALLALYVLIWLVRHCWGRLFPLGAMPGASAVTATLLVLCFGFSAHALEPQSSRVQPQNNALQNEQDRQGPANTDTTKPPVIIPYTGRADRAEKSEKILIPYARYAQLWNQAHPEDTIEQPQAETQISLSDVRYTVTVGQERLDLVLTAQIKTYGKGWAVLAMPISGLAVTRATLDGKAAQLQAGPKGMVLMIGDGTSGRLELEAVTKPQYLGRRGSASFSLPPLPGAVMKVLLPETDLELEVDQLEAAPARDIVNGSVEYTFGLGMTRNLALRWLPRVGAGATDRTLSATSDHDVYAFHWALVGVSRITYSFSGGDYSRFAVLAPEGAMLTELKGTNIRDFRNIGEKTIEGKTFELIEVRLHRAAQEQYELTARWLSPHAGADRTELSLVRAGDVSRESGSITLHAAGGMSVKVAQVSGGRRADIAKQKQPQGEEPTADRARPVAKYYWPYRPFSLSVQMSRPTAAPKVHLDQLVRINTDRVELFVRASLTVDRGKLFGASFALPAGYELLSAVGPAVEDFYERSDDDGEFLHIKFHRGQKETLLTLALVRRDVSLDSVEVPMAAYLDHRGEAFAEQRGRLAVQVAASLEAQTAASENLKSISPRTLRDWLDNRQINAAQFAYRYETAGPSLQLTVRQLPTTIRVEVFAGLVVRATDAVYTYRLRYNISGSPVDHLSFRLPSEYAPLVAVESEGMRNVVQSDAGDGKTEWMVALVDEVTGLVDVVVNFALPVEEATKTLEVVPLETEAPAGRHTIVAIQNMSRHEVNIKDSTNLSDLAVSEQQKLMQRQMRESLQYVLHSFDENWLLNLEIKPAKAATRIQAVVDLLAITTVIDRSGRCRYEAKVALQNRSEQFLRIEMPQGLRLWSAKVASQPVKPAVASGSLEGYVLIPLVKTSPGGLPYEVYLYFADDASGPLVSPLDGITRLEPPNITIVGIPVMRTTWSLRLPSGYRYVRPGGNMSPAAGTVEMLSLGIEAKLEQLKRLEKSYRDAAGSYSRKGAMVRKNWDKFNVKLGREISQAQSRLDSYRGQISESDYERLRGKLGEQKQQQDALIGSNSAFIVRQQEQRRNDLNEYLNVSASNPGVAEILRNKALLDKPEFLAESEQQQIIRLQEELEVSKQELSMLREKTDAQELAGKSRGLVSIKAGGRRSGELVAQPVDKEAEMSKELDRLAAETEMQIDRKQAQLKDQLDVLADNRLQRHFKYQDQGQKAAAPRSSRSRGRRQPQPQSGPAQGVEGYAQERAYGIPGRRPPSREAMPQARVVAGTVFDADSSQTVAFVDTISAQQVPDSPLYVAGGTYSLPVMLPAGEVALDFTRPSGGAELSLWAISNSTLSNLFGSLIVIVGLLAIVGLIRIWPQSFTWRQLSAKRVVAYILLVTILTLILGLLGLIVSLLIILLSEARRGALAHQVAV
ncbi:MAG: hypothetical protein ACYSWO_01405 [Planctomycetota bacterium]